MRTACAVLLAAGAGAAWPLTFGTVEGSARFGSALDVRVPFTLDHRAEALAPCVQVDLWYGRSLRDPSGVRSDVQIVGKTGGSVRVRSAAPIDQSVVTLGVSTTCGLRSGRQFVLVAEGVPSDFRAAAEPDLHPAPAAAAAVAVASAPLPRPADVAAPAVPSAVAPAAAAAPRATAATRNGASPAATRPPAQPVTLARTDALPAKAPAPVAAAALPAAALDQGPRLRLTDWLASTPPAITEAERAHARAVWRVLQTDADVLAREVQPSPAAAPVVAPAAAPGSTAAVAASPMQPPAPPTSASPSPAASVAAPKPRAALWNRFAASLDSLAGLWPFAVAAALLVLAGVVLALRVQRARHARREQERLQSRRSGRDSVSSRMHSQNPTELMPRRSRFDDDFELALDIDLEAAPGDQAAGSLKPPVPSRDPA